MRITFKQPLVGPTYHFTAGQIVDHPDAEAVRLVEAGIAVESPDIVSLAADAFASLDYPGVPELTQPDELLGRIATAVAGIEDPARRRETAAALLGPLASVLKFSIAAAPVVPPAVTPPETATIANDAGGGAATPETLGTPPQQSEAAATTPLQSTTPVPVRRRSGNNPAPK